MSPYKDFMITLSGYGTKRINDIIKNKFFHFQTNKRLYDHVNHPHFDHLSIKTKYEVIFL